MRVLLSLLLWAVLALLVAGQLGGLHPAGDSLAVIQVPLLIAGLVLALLVRWPGLWRGLVLAGLLGTLALRVAGWTLPGPETPGGLALYQKNLKFRGLDHAAFLDDIAATTPDLITLQEVSQRNMALLPALRADYSTAHLCPFAAVGGTAVLSRFAAVPGSARCARGMAAVQVEAPEGPVWLVSIHLHWPYPYRQYPQADGLLEELASLQGPVIIGGDFNMVAWSDRLRSFTRAARSRLVRPFRATLWKGKLPLPIDHVLAPCGGRRETRPGLGSDHLGVLAQVGTGPDCG